MPHVMKALFISIMLLSQFTKAEHVIVCGGPALRAWEDYRTADDRHDRWWANFVRASTLRMAEIRQAYGKDAPLVWLVYKPGYEARGHEDQKPYTTWIAEQAAKRNATLIWFNSSSDFISKINSRPHQSVETFDYFGHSNKFSFMFDYGCSIMAVSIAWLHENEIKKIKSSIFAKNAICKSWGCHTGASMSTVWKKNLGVSLIGAKGKTLYTMVGQGFMPTGYDGWTR